MRNVNFLIILMMFLLQFGCIGGGTHGYIMRYRYNVTKATLETAVRTVIRENRVIKQDSVKNYYNDDSNYISISIQDKQSKYTYVFHYYGDSTYWDSSKTSAISIAYAHDEKRRGGSEGNGGVKWYDFKLKSKLTKPFEREFVLKIDSILSLKHVKE